MGRYRDLRVFDDDAVLATEITEFTEILIVGNQSVVARLGYASKSLLIFLNKLCELCG